MDVDKKKEEDCMDLMETVALMVDTRVASSEVDFLPVVASEMLHPIVNALKNAPHLNETCDLGHVCREHPLPHPLDSIIR